MQNSCGEQFGCIVPTNVFFLSNYGSRCINHIPADRGAALKMGKIKNIYEKLNV
jgi:hypothetical protein